MTNMLQKARNVGFLFILLFGVTVLLPSLFGDGYWYALGTLPGIAILLLSGRKLEQQFQIPLAFLRKEPNHWAGAAGALLGVFGAIAGASLYQLVGLSQLPSIALLFVIYASTLAILFYGAILRDVEAGCIKVGPQS